MRNGVPTHSQGRSLALPRSIEELSDRDAAARLRRGSGKKGERSNFEGDRSNFVGDGGKNSGAVATSAASPAKSRGAGSNS